MRLEHHLVGGYVRYISPYILLLLLLLMHTRMYYVSTYQQDTEYK